MKIALIADAFPPLRSSCAILWRDLSLEFIKQGHQPTVITPCSELTNSWCLEQISGVEVLRLKAPKTKDINYLKRTINEFFMPFWMLRNLRKSPLAGRKWDAIVWYSPTIFLGPLVHWLKRFSGVRSYLVIRDIFPEWALDLKLMRKGLTYYLFKLVARYQYALADVIGVQTPANLHFFNSWAKVSHRRVEVLHNWLADAENIACSQEILNKISCLKGRTILVYAGNMGVAQGMDIFIELANALRDRPDIGFLFVGRGSEVNRLYKEVKQRNLSNVLFHDEIDPSEIPGLLSLCHIGLVALAKQHKTHNIPGKFLTYLQAGLPVLAAINPGNDLEKMIQSERVGRVCTEGDLEILLNQTLSLIDDINTDLTLSVRCRGLSARQFSTASAAQQIISAY